jgi:hypothetical protein
VMCVFSTLTLMVASLQETSGTVSAPPHWR